MDPLKPYLSASTYINFEHVEIQKQANILACESVSIEELIKNSFEWVRDNIKHSAEFKLNPVTCKASDVLKYKTGYCFAKSHLLAALLRANNIPTALCYQRLSLDDKGAPFCLHGLNAVYLDGFGWYRLDPRGNNKCINAQYTPPLEQLAFPINVAGEADVEGYWVEPMEEVIEVLEKYKTYDDVFNNLPDIQRFLN